MKHAFSKKNVFNLIYLGCNWVSTDVLFAFTPYIDHMFLVYSAGECLYSYVIHHYITKSVYVVLLLLYICFDKGVSGPMSTQGIPPPEYQQSAGGPAPYPQQVVVPPIGLDELPPPYTPPGASLSINCKVCQNVVCIDGRQNQNVVKCNFCNEATVS